MTWRAISAMPYLGASMLKIKAAIKIFREIVVQGGGVGSKG